MKQIHHKRKLLFLFFLFLLGSLRIAAWGDTFFGTLPTGIIELTDYKYPVYLFVPANYKPDRTYPLIVTVPGEGESPEKNIKFWMGTAKRKSMLVLAPTNLWPEDLPYRMDEWLLRIKKEVASRYQISPQKIYLIGKDGGAHYAAYLGMKYPDEFSAVALLGGGWVGKFDKLIRPQVKPRKQLPFFVALKEDDADLIQKTQAKAYELEKKGYPVYFAKLDPNEEFSSDQFKAQLMGWFEEKTQDWQQVVAKSKEGFKEKVSIAIEDFFHT